MRQPLLILLLAWSALHAPIALGEEASDGWSAFGRAINSTTAFPLGSEEARGQGWFSGAWDGAKRIWREGTHDIYLSGYYVHMPYAYSAEQREKYNDNAWGLGYGRTLTDERDNQRMFYGIIAADSYNKPTYMVGYAWLARWSLGGDLKVGAGYSAGLVAHSHTTNYFPVPIVTALASIGTDRASLFLSYFYSVTYFFAKVSF